MAYIRNDIEIEGIDSRENVNYGSYVLNHWENGPIFIPKSKGKIKYLTKVIIELNSIEGKVIVTAAGRILSVYGRKLYTLIYSEKAHDRPQKSYLDLPFLAHLYLPPEVEDFCNLEVSVSDAFFEVIDNRKVYNHTLYLIKFDKKENEIINKDSEAVDEKGDLTLGALEKMIMESPLKNLLKNALPKETEEAEAFSESNRGNLENEEIPIENGSESNLEDNSLVKENLLNKDEEESVLSEGILNNSSYLYPNEELLNEKNSEEEE